MSRKKKTKKMGRPTKPTEDKKVKLSLALDPIVAGWLRSKDNMSSVAGEALATAMKKDLSKRYTNAARAG